MFVLLFAYILLLLPLLAVAAIRIPGGTTLDVRQNTAMGTRQSRPGSPVQATLIAPVVLDGQTVIPAGAILNGTVTMVRKLGLGIKHHNASMELRFNSLTLASGERLPIETRLVAVDTARESVDEDGRIIGIRPTANVSSSLATFAWRYLLVNPTVGIPLWLGKLAVVRTPDPELNFPAGTELRLQLTKPLDIESGGTSAAPTDVLASDHAEEFRQIIAKLPEQHARRMSGAASDLINVIVIGSADEIQRAFIAAGWTNSDRKSAGSFVRTYFSIVERRGYRTAPMGTMQLDGAIPGLTFQKNLNSFSKRHHVRLWKRAQQWNGQDVWLSTATEDISIGFSSHAASFTHLIDENIDLERTKVVNDLLFTGCVDSAGLVERGIHTTVSKTESIPVTTDGRVAIIQMSDCLKPTNVPARVVAHVPAGSRALRAFGHVGKDMFRSNFVTLGYHLTRLTTAVKGFVISKPIDTHPGLNMNKQQSEWLSTPSAPEVEFGANGVAAPAADELGPEEVTLPYR